RLVWAAATGLLIVISALGVYFFQKEWTRRPQVAFTPAKTNSNRDTEQGDGRSGTNQPAPALLSSSKGSRHQRQVDFRRVQRRLDLRRAPDRGSSLALNSLDAQSNTVGASPKASNSVEAVRDSSKTLRVELQTRNPNIRIIWFSQKEQKPAFANSKGT
ncbi:MAG TPA: hypothetical protein VGU64_06395, partial [Terriglobales bacterium]|nr:hypothetical protein [Terriglobales bacterium]